MLPSSQQPLSITCTDSPSKGTTNCQRFSGSEPDVAQDATGIFFRDLGGCGAVGLNGVIWGVEAIASVSGRIVRRADESRL
jgi:hypothetical protein